MSPQLDPSEFDRAGQQRAKHGVANSAWCKKGVIKCIYIQNKCHKCHIRETEEEACDLYRHANDVISTAFYIVKPLSTGTWPNSFHPIPPTEFLVRRAGTTSVVISLTGASSLSPKHTKALANESLKLTFGHNFHSTGKQVTFFPQSSEDKQLIAVKICQRQGTTSVPMS